MKVSKYEKGNIIREKNDADHVLGIIAEGTVERSNEFFTDTIGKGHIIGLCDDTQVNFPFEYKALSDVSIYNFDYNSPADISGLLNANPGAVGVITFYAAQKVVQVLNAYKEQAEAASLLIDTVSEEYDAYRELCETYSIQPSELAGMDQIATIAEGSVLGDWLIAYYSALGSYPVSKWKAFYDESVDASAGFILKSCKDTKLILNACSEISRSLDMVCDLYISDYKVDIYTFYLKLAQDLMAEGKDISSLRPHIDNLIRTFSSEPRFDQNLVRTRVIEYRALIPPKPASAPSSGKAAGIDMEKAMQVLTGSLDQILDYCGADDNTKNKVNLLVKSYTVCADRSGTDDDTRKLRKELTAIFYDVYKAAFFKSLTGEEVPAPVKMMFYFGYMDETLAGMDNAAYLYSVVDSISPDPSGHIFTFYDWLKAIYACKKEPCFNEMSMDYAATLHRMKVENSISEAEEEAALKNGKKRVEFEIDNMFRSTNKIISGHVTTFCPVFSDHNLYRSLNATQLSYKGIYDAINKVRSADFSCFYRETTFTAPESGVQKDVIQVEVAPDIILMPAIGTRGAMWQEITGRKRTSPARFVLPLFMTEELYKVMVRMCGEFRWELCRRIQGARWNDLSERSLTSDYCDYLAIFKKSRDLTPEAKEKIKLAYAKCRNSSKEMFVHDYLEYVQFEANGSMRLNKLSRQILFTYCPFRKNIRESLGGNQLYKELTERYKIKNAHSLHLSDLTMQKIEKGGFDVPVEIRAHRAFLEM